MPIKQHRTESEEEQGLEALLLPWAWILDAKQRICKQSSQSLIISHMKKESLPSSQMNLQEADSQLTNSC